MNSKVFWVAQARFAAACLLFFFFAAAAFAQDIDAGIAKYAEKYDPERMYIHYDKAAYAAGETIWFKAYLMAEIFPAAESKTLYVDWISDKGVLLQHSVSPLVDAVTNGQYEIPSDYKGSYIHVRAYTRWMLNFDSAFLYNKTLRVINRNPAAAPKVAAAPTITFFPEGGDAVEGVMGKIAFKANDAVGRPVRVRGILFDNQGKKIDSVRSTHDGMGFFFLEPQPGITYTLKWKDDRNVERTAPLPPAKKSGIVITLGLGNGNRQLNLRYPASFVTEMDTVHVLGTMHQRQAFRFSKATVAGAIRATIPVTELPSGILTITVFDKNWNALAERITYVNNEDFRFAPSMEVDHWGLNKRARNDIRITVPDSIVANLSVSVTDIGVTADSSSNIISHLMLSSDLRGDIYNAAYYFSDTTEAVRQDLDLVMLTHGWRRYQWKEVVAGRLPKMKFQRDTSYMSLSGKVYGVLPGQIQPGSQLVMIIRQKDKEGQLIASSLKPDGTFLEPNVIIFDTANVYFQFPKNKGLSDASVQFMTERLPAPSITAPVPDANTAWADTSGSLRQWLLADEANDIANSMRMKTLENVTVRSKGKTPVQLMDEKYTSGLFTGGDGYQFDLLNDPFASSSMSIFTYLQGKVAGLQINTGSNPPSMQWRGGSPQLYLDEVATDANMIQSVSVNDVAFIKVFRPPFIGGFNGANGAIAIYTRRGNDVKQEPGKGLSTNKVFGYTMIKEFYSPNYASFKAGNDQRDLRTTLYWNPAVIVTPQKKEITLSFYNNDVSKAFRVVIEGMTMDGRLAHVEQTME